VCVCVYVCLCLYTHTQAFLEAQCTCAPVLDWPALPAACGLCLYTHTQTFIEAQHTCAPVLDWPALPATCSLGLFIYTQAACGGLAIYRSTTHLCARAGLASDTSHVRPVRPPLPAVQAVLPPLPYQDALCSTKTGKTPNEQNHTGEVVCLPLPR